MDEYIEDMEKAIARCKKFCELPDGPEIRKDFTRRNIIKATHALAACETAKETKLTRIATEAEAKQLERIADMIETFTDPMRTVSTAHQLKTREKLREVSHD